MKKFYPYLAVLAVPFILLLMANSTGSPGGKTGSPGDGFNNCTECHTGSPTIAQEGWITTNIPVGGYMAGEEYIITVTGTHENVQKFGFELTAEDVFAMKTGTFALLSSRTRFTNNEDAVTHTAEGNVPTGDSNSWDVSWTAPAEGTGDVTFYAALNAANGNGTNSGDQIYLTSHLVTEFSVGLEEPALAEQVKIYPNPVGDILNMTLPGGSHIRMIDLSGRVVREHRAMSEEVSIDVSSLQAGIYFVQVTESDELTSVKILKN